MKHVYFSLLCVAAVVLTSCAHSVYPLESLYTNYNNRMRSPEELKLKANVWIYFNEKEIPGDYNIISANKYNPFCFLPFHSLKVKKMNKKFLEKAVKKADEEGGNAILVQSAGFFYVLNMPHREGLEAPSAYFVNPILDMKYADIVGGKEINSMKHKERTRTLKAFMDEIESNIEYIQDKEEIKAMRKKLDILSHYNLKQNHPKKSIDKFVRKKTRKINRIEKSLLKKEAKAKGTSKSPSKSASKSASKPTSKSTAKSAAKSSSKRKPANARPAPRRR